MLYCQSVYYAHLDLAYIHSSMPRPAILAHTKSMWRWCHGSHAPVCTQHGYIVYCVLGILGSVWVRRINRGMEWGVKMPGLTLS